MKSSRIPAPFLALIAFGAGVSPAAAQYVCTPVTNSAGVEVASEVWQQRCIPYSISTAGTMFAGAARRQLIADCFHTWAGTAATGQAAPDAKNGCTDLEFVDAGYIDNETHAFDENDASRNHNVVAAIEDATAAMNVFPDVHLLALTFSTYSTVTGEILDADILVNASSYKFDDIQNVPACLATVKAKQPYDLRNTLTHEIGHFIGFGHSQVASSTMFNSANPCETSKAALNPDVDRPGLCKVYPKGMAADTCVQPAGGYDQSQQLDVKSFRGQCGRYFEVGSDGLATAPKPAGGCSCRSAELAPSRDVLGVIGCAGLFMILRTRRRRAR